MKLYNDDCLNVMHELYDDGCEVDLILTDPPYNISKTNNNRDRSKFDSPIMRRKKPVNYDFGEWDKMEREEFLKFTHDWFFLATQLLREGGTIISFFSKEDVNYLGWLGKQYNIRTRTVFTWHKTNPVPSFRKVNYLSSCEFAFIGSKGEKGWTFNFGQQKDMHNFFETPNKSSYGVTKHPTEKPLLLMDYWVNIHTNPNDTILDCFMGSGTTGVACVRNNRHFIGIEQDKTYFDIASDRIKEEQTQSKLI